MFLQEAGVPLTPFFSINMKSYHFIALATAPVVCVCVSACSSKAEKTTNAIADLQDDVAEMLLDCENQEDIDKATKKIKKLTAEAEEVCKLAHTDRVAIQEELDQMTRRKSKELQKLLLLKLAKSASKLQDGIFHVQYNLKEVNTTELMQSITDFQGVFSKYKH